MKWRKSKQTAKDDWPAQIAFDRYVHDYIVAELAKSPDVEEGGKYVGYVLREGSPQIPALGLDRSRPALVVTDFLPSGPNAVRTAVELMPDGKYQERLFRQLEQMDAEVEHLGTWHSHHCNGLSTFSSGDVSGYLRTVNREEYRLDYFLASLVKRRPYNAADVDWIDHFLFTRGQDRFYRVNDLVQIVDWPTTFGGHTGHADVRRTPLYTEAKPSHGDEEERSGVAWYETTLGRRILAEDRSRFKDMFGDGVTATRKTDVITLTGRRGLASIGVTYPSAVGASDVTVVLFEDGTRILEVTCDLKYRNRALQAVLAACECR